MINKDRYDRVNARLKRAYNKVLMKLRKFPPCEGGTSWSGFIQEQSRRKSSQSYEQWERGSRRIGLFTNKHKK